MVPAMREDLMRAARALQVALAIGVLACGGEVTPAEEQAVADPVAAASGCARGQRKCNGVCVNTGTSTTNCGGCGIVCPGVEVCSGGRCTGCPAGQTNCGGVCVDTGKNSANCGACGRACTGGEACSNGACACPVSRTLCSGSCVDTATSSTNCGACGVACAAGQSCAGAVCTCPSGQAFCGGACVDTGSRSANCGACGVSCSVGTVCVSGQCSSSCPTGQTPCPAGAPTFCAITETDPQNCGSCGVSCAAGQVCSAGTCATQLGVGAYTFKNDVAGRGTNPMTTPPINTHASGSTFVLFVGAGIAGGSAFQSISDNMGNTYAQVGTTQNYASNQGDLRAFICSNCKGGTGHTFSLTKTSSLSNWEAVIFAIEVTGAPTLDSFAQANAKTSPLSAGNVATTRTGDLLLVCALAASYGSPDVYTPSSGFTVLNDQTNGSNSLGGADAWALAGAPGSYGGTLRSSLASSGAVFLLALAR